MATDLRVLVLEDDLYARDLMSALLTRDWRTRVIVWSGDERDIQQHLQQSSRTIDVVLLDVERPEDPDRPYNRARRLRENDKSLHILCTATRVSRAGLQRLLEAKIDGYVLKRELQYAVAEAVCRCAGGWWVSTPGVERSASSTPAQMLPNPRVVVDGTRPFKNLDQREREVALLAFLFNQSRRDMADELVLAHDTVREQVSTIYTRIGLQAILDGKESPEKYFQDEVILSRFQRAIEARRQGKRPRNMPTLAFHLLTVPEVREIGK